MPRVSSNNSNQLINKFNALKEAFTTGTPCVDLMTLTENYFKWNKSRDWLMRHREQHLDKGRYEYVLASTHDHAKKIKRLRSIEKSICKKGTIEIPSRCFLLCQQLFNDLERNPSCRPISKRFVHNRIRSTLSNHDKLRYQDKIMEVIDEHFFDEICDSMKWKSIWHFGLIEDKFLRTHSMIGITVDKLYEELCLKLLEVFHVFLSKCKECGAIICQQHEDGDVKFEFGRNFHEFGRRIFYIQKNKYGTT